MTGVIRTTLLIIFLLLSPSDFALAQEVKLRTKPFDVFFAGHSANSQGEHAEVFPGVKLGEFTKQIAKLVEERVDRTKTYYQPSILNRDSQFAGDFNITIVSYVTPFREAKETELGSLYASMHSDSCQRVLAGSYPYSLNDPESFEAAKENMVAEITKYLLDSTYQNAIQ